MTVDVLSGATLTTFGEALIEDGGELRLSGGKLDSQVVNIEGGTLAGNGEVFAGTGPIFWSCAQPRRPRSHRTDC